VKGAGRQGFLGAERALELAERALAACEGDEAQVTVSVERSLVHRFANSRATQATDVEDTVVDVLVLRDGACGMATTHAVTPAGLAEAAGLASARAAAIALRSESARYPGLPEGGTTVDESAWDSTTAELDAGVAHATLVTVAAAADAVGGLAFGLATAAALELAIASSTNARRYERRTDARLKAVCRIGEASGYAVADAPAVDGIDASAVGARAAELARLSRDPIELAPGNYTTVFTPAAVSVLLLCLGEHTFNGLAYAEGRSALNGRLGERIAAACIDLEDDPAHPQTLRRAFDDEGVPKQRVLLIDNGVACGVVHDVRSGAAAAAASTGHALAPGGAAEGPGARNLVLRGGRARDLEELVRPVEHGVLVTRLWYANMVSPHEAVISGMTRDATFLIEDGEITRPVRNLRLTDSVLDMLDGAEELTSEQVLVGDDHLYGRRIDQATALCPALRVASVRYTGGSV